jgi:uncharacterized protein
LANFVDVSNALRDPGQEYPINEDVLVEDMELSGDPIRFAGIKVKGEMVGAEERVNVRADVTATLLSRCVRCLGAVVMPIRAEVDAVFARAEDPDDPDLYVFEASTIELTDPVRDALLLELPIRILCKEDCKGICPVCGVDRNVVSCACQEGGEVANPFAALKEFLHDDEEV